MLKATNTAEKECVYLYFMQLGDARYKEGMLRQAAIDFEKAAYYAKRDRLCEDSVRQAATKAYEAYFSAGGLTTFHNKQRSLNDAAWVAEEYGLDQRMTQPHKSN